MRMHGSARVFTGFNTPCSTASCSPFIPQTAKPAAGACRRGTVGTAFSAVREGAIVEGMQPGRGMPGLVLAGRYRVHGQMRSGGYERVWRAYDEVLQVEVTVAEIWAAGERDRVARSLVAAARRLRGHPGVILVNDVVEEDGVLWAVVPFVAGPSLADYRAEHGPMSVELVREIAEDLLDALEAMHEAGIVHGDVRPANIRLAGSRWVLLPGTVALPWANFPPTSVAVASLATLGYSAPEVMRGGPRTPSSDLFSLGATLYHLVAGHSPFHRDSVRVPLAAVMMEEPPPLGPIGGLEVLIDGLLVKNPEARLTVAGAQRALAAVGEARPEPDAEAGANSAGPGPTVARDTASGYAVGTTGLWLVVILAMALPLALRPGSGGDLSGLFVALLPWVVFVLGVFVLVVQARATLARRNSLEVPLWRGYVRSLAPPAPWTDEERERRRAAAERAVDEALLTVDRRLAAASPDSGRGPSDV
ncbi:serine/threonine-protein kinase [Streptomyces sp. NPDC001835]|uniref:serine/threonine-protein kinase n=1 Tax=Streptomyces sp. NPDC001835 TaxID=3154528 RepID=UPI00332B0846